MVEASEADTIVVAYFDRLVRSLAVQAELVARVEAAGGGILAVDVGAVTNGSSARWLSGNVLGLVDEYQRRTTAERTQDAKRRAIERGVPTFDRIPPGYRQREDRTLEPDPVEAPIMREAFAMRADGATIEECHLREHGIEVSYSALTGMLRNRIYLGELSFGELHNPQSHASIVDPTTFQRMPRVTLPRGRKPKSDRLLARLGVLRCGTCGARMVVGQARANGRVYPCTAVPRTATAPSG